MKMKAIAALSIATAATISLAATAHAAAPVNLTVTDAVRAELFQAGAALKGLPTSDFVGLKPGDTYYAYDAETDTFWAGAGLVPSMNSYEGMVSSQDDGSYTLFERPAGGAWRAFQDGVGESMGCPAPLPSTITSIWGWSPQWCGPVGPDGTNAK